MTERTMMVQQIRFSGKRFFRQMVAGLICLVLFLTLSPVRSFAQCEANGAAAAAAANIANEEGIAVNTTMVNALETYYTTDLDVLRTTLGTQDKEDRDYMFAMLDAFWQSWQTVLQKMTAELSAGIVDQSRQLGSINDADNELNASQDQEVERVKSKFMYQPTDQACRFDTAAEALAPDEVTSDELANGFEWDFVAVSNNQFGSIAQDGPGQLQYQRWSQYTTNFCDNNAENGQSGCGTALPNANLDVFVGKMLFGQDTINLPSPVVHDAMVSMIYNITGYVVPDPIVSGAMGTPAGIEQMFTRREYMAQMSAVDSPLYTMLADRAPGKKAPEIQQMREQMGVQNASATPSVNEIRKSIVEQLWNPNYYKDLYDDPSTIAQKEMYLKAYSLVMLYDMISKQEKISDIYAVETANMLSTMEGNRTSFSAHAPVH